MNRRQVLAGLGTVLGTPVAAYGYLSLTTCGPAETAIEDLEHSSERVRTIKGDIVERWDDNSVVVSDGTGRAIVPTRNAVSTAVGKCVWVRGEVTGCIGCRGDEYYFGGLTVIRDDPAELPEPEDIITD